MPVGHPQYPVSLMQVPPPPPIPPLSLAPQSSRCPVRAAARLLTLWLALAREVAQHVLNRRSAEHYHERACDAREEVRGSRGSRDGSVGVGGPPAKSTVPDRGSWNAFNASCYCQDPTDIPGHG